MTWLAFAFLLVAQKAERAKTADLPEGWEAVAMGYPNGECPTCHAGSIRPL